MKRYLFILVLTIILGFGVSSPVSAQQYKFKSTEFAYRTVDTYDRWSNWSSWESSDLLITINLDNDYVIIYSQQTQIYRIIEYVGQYNDNSGGTQMEFRFIDQDNDKGTMRLRKEANGNSQLYIDFANIMWVYNIKRIY